MNVSSSTQDRYWQNWDKGEAAKRINEYWEANEDGWREVLVNDIRTVWGRPTSIFEMGCGSGLIFQKLSDKGLVTPTSYSGGDISLKMLEIAQRRAPSVSFKQLDIFNINLPDQSQENVINIHVLQHLPYYEEPVRELVRIAKKRLYICCWFKTGEDQIHFSPGGDAWDAQGFQNNYYSLDKFLDFLNKNWGECIEKLEVRTFDELNKSVVVTFKDGVPRNNLKPKQSSKKGLLNGESVFLRPLAETELALLVDWRNDPETWSQFFNHYPLAIGQQKQWFEKLQNDSSRKLFTVCTTGGEAIGTVGIDSLDPINQSAEIGNILIGDKEKRGKGYAGEAVTLLVDFCFQQLNLNRLYLHVFEDNVTAVKLYERCGFKQEGVLRQAKFSQGRFRNLLVMSRLRGES